MSINQLRLLQQTQQLKAIGRARGLMRIGDRDPVTGLYEAIYPDNSKALGTKVFNRLHESGEVVSAFQRGDGAFVLESDKAVVEDDVALRLRSPSAVEVETMSGYLNGQIWNQDEDAVLDKLLAIRCKDVLVSGHDLRPWREYDDARHVLCVFFSNTDRNALEYITEAFGPYFGPTLIRVIPPEVKSLHEYPGWGAAIDKGWFWSYEMSSGNARLAEFVIHEKLIKAAARYFGRRYCYLVVTKRIIGDYDPETAYVNPVTISYSLVPKAPVFIRAQGASQRVSTDGANPGFRTLPKTTSIFDIDYFNRDYPTGAYRKFGKRAANPSFQVILIGYNNPATDYYYSEGAKIDTTKSIDNPKFVPCTSSTTFFAYTTGQSASLTVQPFAPLITPSGVPRD